jgi:hypothetical protein
MIRTSTPTERASRLRATLLPMLILVAVAIVAGAAAPSASAAEACVDGKTVDGTDRYRYCLPYVNGPGGGSRVDPTYTAVATQLAGRVTYIICWSKADWTWLHNDDKAQGGSGLRNVLGYAYLGTYVVNLSPGTCRSLDALTYAGVRPTRANQVAALAEAVGTVAHETMHASYSIGNEAKAECYAMQLTKSTATLLGTTAAYARRLARAVWRMYAGYRGTEYWSRKCRNGGPWDLNPGSPVWP